MAHCVEKPELLDIFKGTTVSRVKWAEFDFGERYGIAVEIDGPPKLRHAVRYDGTNMGEAVSILKEWAIEHG